MTIARPSIKKRADRYDILEHLYSDDRFDTLDARFVRSFIEAAFWVRWLHEKPLWRDVWRHMGRPSSHANWRAVVRADVPRWEPSGEWSCEHILGAGPRRGEACGKNPRLSFRVTDPETGQWRFSGWCTKHVAEGQGVQWRESRRDKTNDPTPAPNRGGLLPCYMKSPDREHQDWEDVYRSVESGFVKPAVGVCADGWPIMRRVHGEFEIRKPQLTLILGGSA